VLHALKKYIPDPFLRFYHATLGYVAGIMYGNPSHSMVVIGVTGTNGKSSTVQFIAQLLTELGEKVGYTSTAGFSIAGMAVENRMKMTMPGRFALQSMLSAMKKMGCTYAIVETSSQGLVQYRHVGINYDVAVFTNLTPEHIEAHGGFDEYKKAKGLLFKHLTARSHKFLRGTRVQKQILVNGDDVYAPYFASFPADAHWTFGWQEHVGRGVYAKELSRGADGAQVVVNGVPAHWQLLAHFSRLNALAAVATVHACGFSLADVLRASEKLRDVAGRFERIALGQPFTVIVDYAYEPYALRALFASLPPHTGKVIGVHGSAGGGRDKARRPVIGAVAAEHEDVVVVTNEDSYDEDPQVIIDAVAAGARVKGKRDGESLFTIVDRKKAISFAIERAQPGDVVLITGKGSEPVMAVAGGKTIPWDDRQIVRDVLLSLGYGA
jgi:UDP-N-acetylmuramoyl-L-alanyl-D-glutamate--2,6-diaminopimelate ligase